MVFTSTSKMSTKRMRKNVFVLGALGTGKPKTIRAIMKQADGELMTCLCECAKNILKGNVPLNVQQLSKLKRHREVVRKLASRNISSKDKKKIVLQKGSGFLSALIAPLATQVLAPLVSELIK